MKRLLTPLMIGLVGIQGLSLEAESRPKLVVGIMVDQLRTDYLEDLKGMLTPGGFRRLMDNGVFIKDIDYDVRPSDATSASAIIHTGAFPRQNGITGALVYDNASKSLIPIFNDETYIGNSTSETYSPTALRVTTIGDELSVEEKGKTRIHSIAPDATEAILLAGHTGNSAFWVNDETGRWASTTFYPNPPTSIQNRNYSSPLVSRLDTMKWTPLHKFEPYPFIDSQDLSNGFKYTFSRSDKDVFELYKLSPYINSDITSAATDYISELQLGKGNATDVLNIAYNLSPYPLSGTQGYRYSLQDAYLRLDRDLENLFNTLEKNVGKDNLLIYLVSTGYFEEPPVTDSSYRLPGGKFSVKRAISLLNSYLSAKYGNGAYIDRFNDSQIYFSKSVLEEKNLDLNSVAEDSRDFLVKMSGVSDVYTLRDILGISTPRLLSLRNSIDAKTAGDLIISFTPGWTVTDDSKFPTEDLPVKSAAYQTPAFILAPGIKAKVIEETVEAVDIAPTLSDILRIRPPNSAEGKPLKLN